MVDKENVVYVVNGILFIYKKKEWNLLEIEWSNRKLIGIEI